MSRDAVVPPAYAAVVETVEACTAAEVDVREPMGERKVRRYLVEVHSVPVFEASETRRP